MSDGVSQAESCTMDQSLMEPHGGPVTRGAVAAAMVLTSRRSNRPKAREILTR